MDYQRWNSLGRRKSVHPGEHRRSDFHSHHRGWLQSAVGRLTTGAVRLWRRWFCFNNVFWQLIPVYPAKGFDGAVWLSDDAALTKPFWIPSRNCASKAISVTSTYGCVVQYSRKAATCRIVDYLNKDVVKCCLVVDVRQFARLGVQIVDILHESHVMRLCVVQECGVHFGYWLIALELLE